MCIVYKAKIIEYYRHTHVYIMMNLFCKYSICTCTWYNYNDCVVKNIAGLTHVVILYSVCFIIFIACSFSHTLIKRVNFTVFITFAFFHTSLS